MAGWENSVIQSAFMGKPEPQDLLRARFSYASERS